MFVNMFVFNNSRFAVGVQLPRCTEVVPVPDKSLVGLGAVGLYYFEGDARMPISEVNQCMISVKGEE